LGQEGKQGATGSLGSTGAEGAEGPTGQQGLQGEAGKEGPQGIAGETGYKGDTGSIGPRGFRGETGIEGAQGPRGFRGETGLQGSVGLTGADGLEGATGRFGQGTFTFVSNILNNDNTIHVLNSSSIRKDGEVGWNSNIYSLEAYATPRLSFTVGSVYSEIFAGFSITPSLNTYTSNVNYGFYLAQDSSIHIYESDVLVYSLPGVYTASTVFGIQYDGIQVEYLMDGFIIYTSEASIIQPLHANFILYSNESIHNIHFDPILREKSGGVLEG